MYEDGEDAHGKLLRGKTTAWYSMMLKRERERERKAIHPLTWLFFLINCISLIVYVRARILRGRGDSIFNIILFCAGLVSNEPVYSFGSYKK